MVYRVHLFAGARDLAGTGCLDIELPPGSTVRDVKDHLAARIPKMAEFVERCAIAVNDDYAEDGQVLPAGAEIALIPPVSGG